MKSAGVTIIFLDIDGVLLPFPGAKRSTCGASFPDATLEALSKILEAVPEACLVLSSSWRVAESWRRDIIDSVRIYGYAYGGPLQNVKKFYSITNPDLHTERQHEIYDWLQTHCQNDDNKIKAWVALDDVDLLDGRANARYRSVFEGHVVMTDSHVGLTPSLAEMAIQLLQCQLGESQTSIDGP